MDIKQYRQQVDDEVSQAKQHKSIDLLKTRSIEADPVAAMRSDPAAIIRDKSVDLASRVAALQQLLIDRTNGDASIRILLSVLGDPSEDLQLRRVALQGMKQAAFIPPVFEPHRPEYFAILRGIAREPDPDLREQALEILAIDKDADAQKLLLDGLTGASRALVSPGKAIQFLGYDIHAGQFPVLRKMATESKDSEVRHEALRFLASDPESKDMLRTVMQDKSEDSQTRTLGAMGLQSLDPAGFADAARKIVEDDQEDDDVRASCLGALTHFSEYRDVTSDPAFTNKVNRLQSDAASEHLRSSAVRFTRSIQ